MYRLNGSYDLFFLVFKESGADTPITMDFAIESLQFRSAIKSTVVSIDSSLISVGNAA